MTLNELGGVIGGEAGELGYEPGADIEEASGQQGRPFTNAAARVGLDDIDERSDPLVVQERELFLKEPPGSICGRDTHTG